MLVAHCIKDSGRHRGGIYTGTEGRGRDLKLIQEGLLKTKGQTNAWARLGYALTQTNPTNLIVGSQIEGAAQVQLVLDAQKTGLLANAKKADASGTRRLDKARVLGLDCPDKTAHVLVLLNHSSGSNVHTIGNTGSTWEQQSIRAVVIKNLCVINKRQRH
jgi:hypothetical protein